MRMNPFHTDQCQLRMHLDCLTLFALVMDRSSLTLLLVTSCSLAVEAYVQQLRLATIEVACPSVEELHYMNIA